jgi:hypothetical protein
VAVAGAVITARLSEQVPAQVALSQAVPLIFAVMTPLLVVAFGLATALPVRPLRTTAHIKENA